MLPRLEPEERLQPSDRLILGGIGVVVFGGFALDVLMDFAWLKAGALVMLAAWLGLIVVHEVGHALMAAALGWRVCRIAIGMGKPLLRFRVAGVPVQLCRYPVGGHVVPAPRQLVGARWKSSLIYFAGPGAELLVLLLLVLAVGFDALTGSPDSFAVLSAQATAVAALLGVVFNLIPMATRDGAVTDGLGLLMSPWLPSESFAARQALPYTTTAESLLLTGGRARAAELLKQGSVDLQDNLPALVRISEALLDADEPGAVIDLLDPIVQRDDVPKGLQPMILAHLAGAIVRALPGRLTDAEDYTAFAIEMSPHNSVVQLARARVLVELERLHPAQALLSAVDRDALDDCHRDLLDVLRAQLELRRGQRGLALQLTAELDSRGARGPELDLLRRELGIDGDRGQKHA